MFVFIISFSFERKNFFIENFFLFLVLRICGGSSIFTEKKCLSEMVKVSFYNAISKTLLGKVIHYCVICTSRRRARKLFSYRLNKSQVLWTNLVMNLYRLWFDCVTLFRRMKHVWGFGWEKLCGFDIRQLLRATWESFMIYETFCYSWWEEYNHFWLDLIWLKLYELVSR